MTRLFGVAHAMPLILAALVVVLSFEAFVVASQPEATPTPNNVTAAAPPTPPSPPSPVLTGTPKKKTRTLSVSVTVSQTLTTSTTVSTSVARRKRRTRTPSATPTLTLRVAPRPPSEPTPTPVPTLTADDRSQARYSFYAVLIVPTRVAAFDPTTFVSQQVGGAATDKALINNTLVMEYCGVTLGNVAQMPAGTWATMRCAGVGDSTADGTLVRFTFLGRSERKDFDPPFFNPLAPQLNVFQARYFIVLQYAPPPTTAPPSKLRAAVETPEGKAAGTILILLLIALLIGLVYCIVRTLKKPEPKPADAQDGEQQDAPADATRVDVREESSYADNAGPAGSAGGDVTPPAQQLQQPATRFGVPRPGYGAPPSDAAVAVSETAPRGEVEMTAVSAGATAGGSDGERGPAEGPPPTAPAKRKIKVKRPVPSAAGGQPPPAPASRAGAYAAPSGGDPTDLNVEY